MEQRNKQLYVINLLFLEYSYNFMNNDNNFKTIDLINNFTETGFKDQLTSYFNDFKILYQDYDITHLNEIKLLFYRHCMNFTTDCLLPASYINIMQPFMNELGFNIHNFL